VIHRCWSMIFAGILYFSFEGKTICSEGKVASTRIFADGACGEVLQQWVTGVKYNDVGGSESLEVCGGLLTLADVEVGGG
jgi:hypothetical protein